MSFSFYNCHCSGCIKFRNRPEPGSELPRMLLCLIIKVFIRRQIIENYFKACVCLSLVNSVSCGEICKIAQFCLLSFIEETVEENLDLRESMRVYRRGPSHDKG
jgi:hypothetical protein